MLFRLRTVKLASAIAFVIGVCMLGTITFLPTFLQIANGVSASSAGILLAPQALGILGASVLAGQILTRTGHYRFLPIGGTFVAATGMFLLSTLGTDTSRLQSSLYMVVFGIGIGFTLPVIIVATQNEAPVEHLGAATATVNFFRAVGSSIGVAIFGALYTSQLVSALGTTGAEDATPEGMKTLSPALQHETATAVADAITHVFRWGVPILLVAFVLAWFIREVPLRTSSGTVADPRARAGRRGRTRLRGPGVRTESHSDADGCCRQRRYRRERRRCHCRCHCRCGGGRERVVTAVTLGLRERKKAETRLALSAAALRLADERGLDNVTVGEIAAEAGVSPRTFFNYFPTKEDAIIGISPTLTAAIVEALRERPEHEAPFDSLRAAVHTSTDQLEQEPDTWFLRRRLATRHPSLGVLQSARFAAVERELVVEIARRTGLDPDTDSYPSSVVGATLAVTRGALAVWGARGRRGSLPALFDQVFDQLAAGFAVVPLPSSPRRGPRRRA